MNSSGQYLHLKKLLGCGKREWRVDEKGDAFEEVVVLPGWKRGRAEVAVDPR